MVLIGKELVAKIPRMQDLGVIKRAVGWVRHYGFSEDKRRRILRNLRREGGVGVRANCLESRLFNAYPDLIVPIRFDMGRLGLMNVQDRADYFDLGHEERYEAFSGELGNMADLIFHTIREPNNFGVHEGRIKILDGGGEGLKRLLEMNRDAVERALHRMEEMAGIG